MGVPKDAEQGRTQLSEYLRDREQMFQLPTLNSPAHGRRARKELVGEHTLNTSDNIGSITKDQHIHYYRTQLQEIFAP